MCQNEIAEKEGEKWDDNIFPFTWVPGAQLYSLAETLHGPATLPPSPRIWAHVYEGAIGQQQ